MPVSSTPNQVVHPCIVSSNSAATIESLEADVLRSVSFSSKLMDLAIDMHATTATLHSLEAFPLQTHNQIWHEEQIKTLLNRSVHALSILLNSAAILRGSLALGIDFQMTQRQRCAQVVANNPTEGPTPAAQFQGLNLASESSVNSLRQDTNLFKQVHQLNVDQATLTIGLVADVLDAYNVPSRSEIVPTFGSRLQRIMTSQMPIANPSLSE